MQPVQLDGSQITVASALGVMLEAKLEAHMKSIPPFIKPYFVFAVSEVVAVLQSLLMGGDWQTIVINGITTCATAMIKHQSPLGSNADMNK